MFEMDVILFSFRGRKKAKVRNETFSHLNVIILYERNGPRKNGMTWGRVAFLFEPCFVTVKTIFVLKGYLEGAAWSFYLDFICSGVLKTEKYL